MWVFVDHTVSYQHKSSLSLGREQVQWALYKSQQIITIIIIIIPIKDL